MSFIRQYDQLFGVTTKIPISKIKPRNIYKIQTYKGGDPITKTGSEMRYVYVIGEIDNKIHCLKLNDIKPTKFIEFLNEVRDKRIEIKTQNELREVTKKFNDNGQGLFDSVIKRNPSIYSKKLNNYRIYILGKIQTVETVKFEPNLLKEIFKVGNNETQRRNVVVDEIKERDG